jgi:hypothetical protein
MLEDNLEILNLIPEEILNIIFKRIRPTLKYNLNKKYFIKYYHIRFTLVNNKHIFFHNKIIPYNLYIINNINYIKYLIKYDNKFILETILINKLENDKTNFILNKKIFFENKKFDNLFNLLYYYSNKNKSYKILSLIDYLIKKYNLSMFLKKQHKNNNKNYNKNKIWMA